ncbi:MAG: glycosyltransferase [Rhizobiaceae bacterium]|nr:glycosyltransferase [Rhizobiaceae bacterium]
MSKTILLLTYGTRGDVEPYLALALGLQKAGFRPVLATSERFQSWIATFGIEVYPLTDAVLALIETNAGKALIEGTQRRWTRLKSGFELTRKSGPLNGQLVRDCGQAAQDIQPDLIVFHPKAFAAPHIAAHLDIPVAMGVFQPVFVPTAEFPLMGMEFLPKTLNRFSYKASTAAYRMFRKPVNELRKGFGLPAIYQGRHVLFPPERATYRLLHAISPALMPRPADWPAQAEMTGFWQMPETKIPLPPQVEAFIGAGEKPVFIGFGSMVSSNPQALGQMITDALAQTNLRAVVAKGWARLEVGDEKRILSIDPIPYDGLFPHMAAVVHHGGLGTTITGLRAGVPSIIVPFFGDQPFWGRRIAALGLGPEPLPRNALTSGALASAMMRATTDQRMQDATRAMAASLQSEHGVETAIKRLAALI